MATADSSPEVLRDSEGSVQIGWAAPHVLLVRFEGALNSTLGKTFANHLHQLLSGQQGVHYFGDASRLKHYDLVARSAFVRVVLEHRKAFAALQILMPGPELSVAELSLAAAVGEPLRLVLDPSAFAAALASATTKGSLKRHSSR
jgi:hypothetical protein